jgi:hypothetical protein
MPAGGGFTRAGILMGFLVPVLNLFAVLALLLRTAAAAAARDGFLVKQLIGNPLIIASFAGIVWSYLQLPCR